MAFEIIFRPRAKAVDGFQPVLDRIFKKCRINHDNGCWEWEGATGFKGYGRVRVFGRLHLPHRVVAFCVGIIDNADKPSVTTNVLHACDNPKCCNPKHLSRGTQSDNMKDCAAKGRSRNQFSGV
jgi:hypothetical protein